MERVELHHKNPGKKIIFINFDECCMPFDILEKNIKTCDFKGKEEILLKTTRGSKINCTALFSITSDGEKLPPLIIFKKGKENAAVNFNNDQ